MDFSVSIPETGTFITAVRHASDALTFHVGEIEGTGRRANSKRGAGRIRFRISLRVAPEAMHRRGLVTKAIKVILLRVTAKIADLALPALCKRWEELSWKRAGLREGLIQVDQQSLLNKTVSPPLKLSPISTGASDVSLLLLHGTFSHAQSAFGGLAEGEFFSRAKKIYGDRIYAFNHFTISKTSGGECERSARKSTGDHWHLRRRHSLARRIGIAEPCRTSVGTPRRHNQTLSPSEGRAYCLS